MDKIPLEPITVSSRYIKISGNFEIPVELKIGNDYDIVVNGSITACTEKSDEQGGVELEYRFRPATGEITNEKGQTVKLSDKRRDSVKMRNMIQKVWFTEGDPEEYYHRVMGILLANGEELREWVDKKLN